MNNGCDKNEILNKKKTQSHVYFVLKYFTTFQKLDFYNMMKKAKKI